MSARANTSASPADWITWKEQHSYLRNLAKQFASYIDEAGAEHLPGRRFLDWPSNDDDVAKHAGLQGLMAFAFRRGAELAAALGDRQLLELCRTTITRLSNHRPECTGNKTAAALQILGGIADRSETLLLPPREKHQHLRRSLRARRHGPTGQKSRKEFN
ncbi:MAG: hypothetical protein L6W00_23990 [Lentisphaeria bacterium]|nr:MAG: hypothetical protein L6W00_23990 [Lentisphaeria bacterium]